MDNVDNGVVGRVERLPFEENSFDIAVCNALLPYLPEDPEEVSHTDKNPHYLAFEELNRILKPSGMAAVELVDELPYEQLYLFEKSDIAEVLEENDPQEPLNYPAGEEIEFRP